MRALTVNSWVKRKSGYERSRTIGAIRSPHGRTRASVAEHRTQTRPLARDGIYGEGLTVDDAQSRGIFSRDLCSICMDLGAYSFVTIIYKRQHGQKVVLLVGGWPVATPSAPM